jgi:DNA-binding NarL/FixJ family response regulator
MTMFTEFGTKSELKPLGLVWIKCSYSTTLSFGLEWVLQAYAHVHRGQNPPPEGPPSLVILCPDGEDVASEVKLLRTLVRGIPSLIFSSHRNLQLARSALKVGARGFIHAEMPHEQIVRALLLASEGVAVMPGEVLEDLVREKPQEKLSALTSRQLEILELVAEGQPNASIAQRLSLSESTIKEHLRAVYKALGVENRTQAARLFQRNNQLDATLRNEAMQWTRRT